MSSNPTNIIKSPTNPFIKMKTHLNLKEFRAMTAQDRVKYRKNIPIGHSRIDLYHKYDPKLFTGYVLTFSDKYGFWSESVYNSKGSRLQLVCSNGFWMKGLYTSNGINISTIHSPFLKGHDNASSNIKEAS